MADLRDDVQLTQTYLLLLHAASYEENEDKERHPLLTGVCRARVI